MGRRREGGREQAAGKRAPGRRRWRGRVLVLLLALAPVAAPTALGEPLVAAAVVRVIDGDSLVAAVGGRPVEVRLAGIDAPEWRQPFGRAARDGARRLLGAGPVRLASRARDGYGRVVCDVYLADGRSVAHLLVAAGLAWRDRYRPNAALAALEEAARRARVGLWAAPQPEPPWAFRRRSGRRRGR